MAAEPLCLLSVHAHPDDESSKGAGTVARYHAEGVRTVLVCCTGGEEGDILNPAMDRPEVKADIAAVRRAELDKAAAIIGYDEVEMLGYRDSGMPDSEANANPLSFAQAPMDEAVGRLVAIIRRTRPQVILTYGDEQGGYPHPDHIKVHDITQPAVDRAADPDWYPEAGEPWQVSKIYYSVWSRKRIELMHAKFLELASSRPSARTGSSGRRRTTASPRRSTSRASPRCASRRCSPTPPRSIPSRRSGSGCPARSPARSTPTTTTSGP